MIKKINVLLSIIVIFLSVVYVIISILQGDVPRIIVSTIVLIGSVILTIID